MTTTLLVSSDMPDNNVYYNTDHPWLLLLCLGAGADLGYLEADAGEGQHWCWEVRDARTLPKAVKELGELHRKHRKQVSEKLMLFPAAVGTSEEMECSSLYAQLAVFFRSRSQAHTQYVPGILQRRMLCVHINVSIRRNAAIEKDSSICICAVSGMSARYPVVLKKF